MPQIIDQYERKRCQKKRKDLSYQLLSDFFQKYFVVQERSGVKNLLSTYEWSKVDSYFCESVYVCLGKTAAPSVDSFWNVDFDVLFS